MLRDITYCAYDKCPMKNCMRHMNRIRKTKVEDRKIFSMADFRKECYIYKTWFNDRGNK